jgi:hypothetical protein
LKFFLFPQSLFLSLSLLPLFSRVRESREGIQQTNQSLSLAALERVSGAERATGERGRAFFFFLQWLARQHMPLSIIPLSSNCQPFSLFSRLSPAHFPFLFSSAFIRQASREGDRIRRKEKKNSSFRFFQTSRKEGFVNRCRVLSTPSLLFLDSLSTSGSSSSENQKPWQRSAAPRPRPSSPTSARSCTG